MSFAGRFAEDAPRPPVPGEEGELVPAGPRAAAREGSGGPRRGEGATPRRPDLDLGYEPEGSASPGPPCLRWAASLHSLLDDRDGTQLFRAFLRRQGSADLLDFWFACSGFRKLEPGGGGGGGGGEEEERRLRLARAIYKKYVLDGGGVVSRRLKAATKSFVRDCVLRRLLDPAMFDQAQTEIQTSLEESPYPAFLKSDLYLELASAGGGESSPRVPSDQSSGDSGKGLPRYLPTLNEDEEWGGGGGGGGGRDLARGQEEAAAAAAAAATGLEFAPKLLLEEEAAPRATTARCYSEGREYRPWREAVHPYYVNTGCALAPATSANDSEQHSMSSDADTMSLPDSSIDGVPPYRLRKQHRREMQESAKANGRVPLPHIPRTYRIPKDIHVEPQKFAAELINRLEEVLRDREAEAKLEERLKRVRAEEEGEEAEPPLAPPLLSHRLPHCVPRYAELQLRDAHEENPESILDEHVQRVMRTPGCQSPDGGLVSKLHGPMGSVPLGHAKHASKSGPKLDTANLYHHKHVYHVHHHSSLKAKEALEAEAGQRLQGSFAWSAEPNSCATKSRTYGESLGLAPPDAVVYSGKPALLSKRSARKTDPGKTEGAGYDVPGSPEDLERNQKILQWIIEGEKEISRHRKTTHSASGAKKQPAHDLPRPVSVDRPVTVHPWVSFRNVVQPSHPFIQDPTMPPNPAPNPLTQLEEARRRLEEEEEKKAGKPAGKPKTKPPKRLAGSSSQPGENIVVAYYFCGEPIPYRTLIRGRVVTLGQFKELLTKKGNYRFYFKKVSNEFDCGVVFEEVQEEQAVLPIFEEKIIGKVEKID